MRWFVRKNRPNMTADTQHVGAGMGTNYQRAGRRDAGDTTSEGLEGKKGRPKPNVSSCGYRMWVDAIWQVST